MVKVVLDWPGLCLFTGDFTEVTGGGSSWDSDMERNRECFRSLAGVAAAAEVSLSLRDKDLQNNNKKIYCIRKTTFTKYDKSFLRKVLDTDL